MDDNHWIYVTKDLNTATKTRDGRNMRKAIFEAVTGERVPKGAQPVNCGVRKCMNPMHITEWKEN